MARSTGDGPGTSPNGLLPQNSPFSFKKRPVPVPGDMRIGWRVGALLIIMRSSRAQRSSLARLHIINDALINPSKRHLLSGILTGSVPVRRWRLSIEPALGRAVDLMAGEALIKWDRVNDQLGVSLTQKGKIASSIITSEAEIFKDDRKFIEEVSTLLNETTAATFIKGIAP